MKQWIVCLMSLCLSWQLLAQIESPQPSPLATSSQKVGLTEVKLEYSRPSAKNRKVFGDLVPFGAMWRTGANASSKITFSDKVTVNNVTLDKGTYAIYTIPNAKEWTIILHKNTTYWGTDDNYKIEEDAVRINVPVQATSPATETFNIYLDNVRNSSADLVLQWENTRVAMPFSVDTDNRVMTSIKKVMDGPSANDFYAAARYYHEENKDPKQALAWVNTSLEKGGDKFWILRLKSLLEAKVGDYKAAIATANKSKELAEKEGNQDYVKMNMTSIEEWKRK